MMSPVSGRSSSLVSSLTQRAPLGDAKAASAKPTAAQGEEKSQDPLAELEKLIQMLMEQLKRAGALPPGADMGGAGGGGGGGGGGAAPAAAAGKSGGGGGGGGGGMPAAAGGAPAMAPYSLGGAEGGGSVVEGIQVSDPQLAQALQQVASHPEGAALIQAAKANGLTSISANSGLGQGIAGLTRNGAGGPSIEIANPNSPNVLDTLVHELGHAATTADGNSQLEEKTVDALGKRIMQDLTGRSSSFDLDEGFYSNLPTDNGILNNLRNLGVRV